MATASTASTTGGVTRVNMNTLNQWTRTTRHLAKRRLTAARSIPDRSMTEAIPAILPRSGPAFNPCGCAEPFDAIELDSSALWMDAGA
jgi:hypothetical protein